MQTTTNYELKKPESEDFYNVEDQNDNMDIIDEELGNLNDAKVDKTSIVHNADVDDATKIPGMDLINNMHKKISTLDNNLKLRTYVDLENMGLSISSLVNTTADVVTVVNAMTDRSMSMLTFGNGQFGLPPSAYGVIEIKKHSINRVSLIAVDYFDKKLYYGSYHGAYGFSGWYAVTGTLLT